MPGRNVFLAQAGIAQGLERSELVERMKPYPFVILGERVILCDAALADDARNSLRLSHALLFHQQFQGAITPAAGRDLEHAGLVALTIDHGPDVEALQQGALRNAFGELLD